MKLGFLWGNREVQQGEQTLGTTFVLGLSALLSLLTCRCKRSSVPRGCTQGLHSGVALKGCTQGLHQGGALRGCTQGLHSRVALKGCTPGLHSGVAPRGCSQLL